MHSGLDSGIRNDDNAVRALEDAGARIVGIVATSDYAIAVYCLIATAEASRTWRVWMGLGMAFEPRMPMVRAVIKQSRSKVWSEEAHIMLSTHALSRHYDEYYLKALKARTLY